MQADYRLICNIEIEKIESAKLEKCIARRIIKRKTDIVDAKVSNLNFDKKQIASFIDYARL